MGSKEGYVVERVLWMDGLKESSETTRLLVLGEDHGDHGGHLDQQLPLFRHFSEVFE